ncbi:MAG: NUDIX hydrolase [Hyphomonadaceae bacterium]
MKPLKPWRVLRTRTIFADAPHISVSADDVELPSGRVVEGYYQIGSRDSCAVVATTEDGAFVMLRQYKHGARKVCLTFPGGRREDGEELLDTARRELREETGYEAQDWRSLGRFPIHANQHVGLVEIFRAECARPVAAANAGDLEEMELALISQGQARSALKDGEIALLGDAAALTLALSETR